MDPVKFAGALVALPRFLADLARFVRSPERPIPLRKLYPCLHDRAEAAGCASGHYFHQDLYVARQVFARRPARHVDVGSRIDGFVAHLLTFMPVEVVDVRPLDSRVPGLTFRQADASSLEPYGTGELESISCLHAAEHFGLGRYGDALDPRGHEKAIAALRRVTRPGGRIYFSVPVSGHERVEFNAHRVFRPQTIVALFTGCRLVDFALVDDRGDLRENATFEDAVLQRFGCGIFTFERA
jgi:SAM-dependent methyltransferase